MSGTGDMSRATDSGSCQGNLEKSLFVQCFYVESYNAITLTTCQPHSKQRTLAGLLLLKPARTRFNRLKRGTSA